MISDEHLQAIKARAEHSTPDLEYGSVSDDGQQKEDVIFSFSKGRVATLLGGLSLQTCDNGVFFTRARPDILALVAEIERLRAMIPTRDGGGRAIDGNCSCGKPLIFSAICSGHCDNDE